MSAVLLKLVEEFGKFLRHKNFLWAILGWMIVQGVVHSKEVMDFVELVMGKR